MSFQPQALAALKNGFLPVKIAFGSKSPNHAGWQNARLTAEDIASHHAGFGVLCGQGQCPIYAIDIDVTDAVLASAFEAWCVEHLGYPCERVGKSPKMLLVYRGEAGIGKSSSAWASDADGKRHRVEILGRGQQFVAFGIHPDTHKPYEWVDLLGGIEAVRADDLPLITAMQMNEALRQFEHLAKSAGLMLGGAGAVLARADNFDDDPLFTEPPVGLNANEVRELLNDVGADYETWLKTGMALHHEFAGGDEGFDLWHEWSRDKPKYEGESDLRNRWQGFGKRTGTLVTMRTILKFVGDKKKTLMRQERVNAIEAVKSDIKNCNDQSILLGSIARDAVVVAEGDIAVRLEFQRLIGEKYKEITGFTISKTDLNHAMTPVKSLSVGRHPLTEFGNMMRMNERFGKGLMFVPEINQWHCWTGSHWRTAHDVDLEYRAKDTILALNEELNNLKDDDAKATFRSHIHVSQRAKMVRDMVSLLKSEQRCTVSISEIDQNKNLLGVGNGAVDLTTGKLIPPEPNQRITISARTDYDPQATCPTFEKTVSDAFFGDVELIEFLQRVVGYSLTGNPKESILVIPHGGGSNGKSTIFNAIFNALGAHSKRAGAETFLTDGAGKSNAGGAREDILRLRGARFVYVGEPDEGNELREAFVKSMTGGESLTARGMYAKSTIEVYPTWVPFMPTNHRPIIKGDDWAIWRRIVLLPFLRNFDTDPNIVKDINLPAKLQLENKGILAWCVRGAMMYHAQGLNRPKVVQDDLKAYREDMDLLAEWLEECCAVGPNEVCTSGDAWKSWESFARERGELTYIRSSKALGKKFVNRFRQIKNECGIRGRGWEGFSIKNLF